jgi:hypothetical protein
MGYIVIDEIENYAGDRKTCISIADFEGSLFLDVRYWDKPNKKWVPTNQGIRVPVSTIDQFMAAIMAAGERLKSLEDGRKDQNTQERA